MAETGGLENRIPGNRDEGSNPSPSANSSELSFIDPSSIALNDVFRINQSNFSIVGEGARLSVEPIADGSETKLTSIHCPGDELVSLAGSDL